jgi:pimeloyl-ACP methyl ester carboxylesterase
MMLHRRRQTCQVSIKLRNMFIQIDDATIYSVAFGPKDAPAIIGIGGWTGNWELWAETFSILSNTWRTIGYDHRGTGATVAPVSTITFDRLINDVFAVLDAHGIKSCVLAAESAGAMTALGAALKRPERISGLVLVDGMWFAGTPQPNDPFEQGLRTNYLATLQRFVAGCLPEPDSEHIKQWGMHILQQAASDAAIALYLMGKGVDLSNDLPRIMLPALIIHGEKDMIVPADASRRLASLLPNAKLVTLKDAGHVPTVTFPIDVAREINHFFKP